MKYNLKNPLWKDDPHMARAMFKLELQERLKNHDCTENPCLFSKIIREILGEEGYGK